MVTNTIVTDAAVSATLAQVGNVISVECFDTFALYLNYTKGNEDGLKIEVYGLRTVSGDEHALGKYVNANGVRTEQPSKEFQFTGSGKKIPMVFDVRGVNYISIYQQRTGAVAPTGTFTLSYLKTKK